MKKLAIRMAAALCALAAVSVYGDWAYRGQWGNGRPSGVYFGYPASLAVGLCGVVYVTDRDYHRVLCFSGAGESQGDWGSFGTGAGLFMWPLGIDFSPDGERVYVADVMNHRVQVFTAAGSFLGCVGVGKTGAYPLRYPTGVSSGPGGDV